LKKAALQQRERELNTFPIGHFSRTSVQLADQVRQNQRQKKNLILNILFFAVNFAAYLNISF